jgi:hypothetical protein
VKSLTSLKLASESTCSPGSSCCGRGELADGKQVSRDADGGLKNVPRALFMGGVLPGGYFWQSWPDERQGACRQGLNQL